MSILDLKTKLKLLQISSRFEIIFCGLCSVKFQNQGYTICHFKSLTKTGCFSSNIMRFPDSAQQILRGINFHANITYIYVLIGEIFKSRLHTVWMSK